MKATARKLLALIMAMAMCLSLLQGVAFAAESSEAEAEPEVVDVVETKEEKEEVEEQAVALSTNIALKDSSDASKGFTVTVSGEDKPREYKWSDNGDEYVTVTQVGSSKALVSEDAVMTFTATLVASKTNVAEANRKVSYVKKTTKIRLDDASIAWKDLTDDQNWQAMGSSVAERMGQVYEEKNSTGYVYFFRLNPVKDKAFDTSASHAWVYARHDSSIKLDSDAKLTGGLFAADGAKVTGETDSSVDLDKAATLSREIIVKGAYTYAFGTYENVKIDTGAESDPSKIGLVDSTKTGSFKVKVTYGSASTVETDSEAIKTALNKEKATQNWEVDSISADTAAGFWNVTIKAYKGGGDSSIKDDKAAGTNTELVTIPVLVNDTLNSVTKAILLDTKESGYYTNGDDAMKMLDAGTVQYGNIYVTKVTGSSSVAEKDEYDSLDALKKDATNRSCKTTLTIEYKEVVLNKKINGVKNAAYDDNSGSTDLSTWTLLPKWYDATGDQIRTGTLTVAPNDEKHVRVKEESVVDSTCKTAGTKTSVEKCKVCGKVFTSGATESIAVKSAAADKSTNPDDWTLTKAVAEVPANLKGTAPNQYYHYIATREVTDVVAPTKDKDGSYTVKYKCNLGEYHEELQKTVTVDKSGYDHSGKWTGVQLGNQNTSEAKDPAKLYGYDPYIFDADYDFPDMLINSNGEQFFQLPYVAGTTTFADMAKQADGTYYIELVDAKTPANKYITTNIVTGVVSNTKTTTSKIYRANIVIKDIKNGTKECQDGSATIELNVYETTATGTDIDPANVAKSIASKAATLVYTQTVSYAVPAEKSHSYKNVTLTEDGKTYSINECTVCGYKDESSKKEIIADTEHTIVADWISVSKLTWTGKVAQPKVVVTNSKGEKLAKGIDYEVEEVEDTAAGDYEVIVVGKGEYNGRAAGKFTIAKASQTIKATPATKAYTVKALKKKAATFTIKVTGKKNGAKLSYTSSNAKIATVKDGKVTVKKGAKKGTAKITIQAKATKNVKASKKVTVTITVK